MSRVPEYQEIVPVRLNIPFQVHPDLTLHSITYRDGSIGVIPVGLEIPELKTLGSLEVIKKNVLNMNDRIRGCTPAGDLELRLKADELGAVAVTEDTMPLNLEIIVGNQTLTQARLIRAIAAVDRTPFEGGIHIDESEFIPGKSGNAYFSDWGLASLNGYSLFNQEEGLFDRIRFVLTTSRQITWEEILANADNSI